MREATSVKKGWVVVGLVLLVSGLAGFEVSNSPAYAQVFENNTIDTPSSMVDPPLDQTQNQDSLIATPGPSIDELNPSTSTQESSVIGEEKQDQDQQNSAPNTATSSGNIVEDEQGLDTGDLVGNSVVQNPTTGSEELENRQPGVREQTNRPETDDNDNNAGREQRDQADEANGGDEEDEEDEEDEDDEDDEDDGSKEIPSSLRNWLPFP